MKANKDRSLSQDLTIGEVAWILKCSPSNVYSLVHTGKLAAVRTGVRKGYRIAPAALAAFRASNPVRSEESCRNDAPPRHDLKRIARER